MVQLLSHLAPCFLTCRVLSALGHQSRVHRLDLNTSAFSLGSFPGTYANSFSLTEGLQGGDQGVDLEITKWSRILKLTVATCTSLEVLLNLKPCLIIRTVQ